VKANQGAFKTPTLRNVTLTAPYMHNGAYRTLEQVVDHTTAVATLRTPVAEHETAAPERAGQADLVEFMKTLTGNRFKSCSAVTQLSELRSKLNENSDRGRRRSRVRPLRVERANQAAEVTVEQKDKQFSVKQLKVKVGDSVSFKNVDPYFHNVFSLSDTKTFDLGAYPQARPRQSFSKNRVGDVECAVHPGMRMTVEVAK